jgi:hypothetical protein
MTTTNTITKVRNYQGTNSFILKMKDSLNKWGRLTDKQSEAVEKILSGGVDKVNVNELPEDLKRIVSYEGDNTFVNDLKGKLMKYGTLTYKQIEVANKQIQRDEDKKRTYNMNIPTIGETIKVGRSIGQKMKETYGLKFNPILLDITKVLAVSPRAVKFSGKMTVKRGDVCVCCAKTLTDEFSMLTKMGKQCSKHMGFEYITDRSQAERFREEYLKKVEEIGELHFWVPKSKIVKWDGKTEVILKMI